MKTNEKGVRNESDVFFLTPSGTAADLLYYVTRCGHYYCTGQYTFSSNSKLGKHPERQTMLMMYIQTGSLSLVLNGETYRAGANQLILIDCLYPHEYWANEDTEFFWAHLDGVNTRDFCKKIITERGIIFTVVKSSSFTARFNEIIESCTPTVGVPEIIRSQTIYQLLCMAYTANASASASAEGGTIIDKALRYIEEHLFEDLNVNHIAEHIGMSSSHFSRQFKETTSYSPHEYVIVKRLDHAQWLLYASDLPVKEIAFQTGYNSETNFIVSFRKKMGISPSRFRKLTKANPQIQKINL